MIKTAAGSRTHPAMPVNQGANASHKPDPASTPMSEPDTFASMGGSNVPAFNVTILRQTLQTIPWPETEPDATINRKQAAMAALEAFRPCDEIEGMLAAQITALHFSALECLRRAILPEQPAEIASRLHRDAAALCRTMAEMLDALDRRRGKVSQIVRVERVVVHDERPTVVGVVAPPTVSADKARSGVA